MINRDRDKITGGNARKFTQGRSETTNYLACETTNFK